MSGDNASSRDSAVIDEDLVEALGFEPLQAEPSAIAGRNDSETDLVGSSPSIAAGDDAVVTDDASPSEIPDEVGSASLNAGVADELENDVSDSSVEENGQQGVVILGEVTPVEAGDPVAGDIAAAILGDSDDTMAVSVESSAEEVVAEGYDLGDEVAGAETVESLFGDRIISEEHQEAEAVATSAPGLFDESAIDGTEAHSTDSTEAHSTDGTEAHSTDSTDSTEAHSGDSPAESTVLGSAFPDVPALRDDQPSADSEDRELLTQPVVVGLDELPVSELGLEAEADLGAPPVEVTKPVPAPVGSPPAKRSFRRKRVRAKKTRRVIRHIDPWSVLTFSFLFHLAVYAAFLLASVLVWRSLEASGMVVNIEDFIIALGDYETYEINADVLFRAAVVIAGILTVASTILSVLLCVVFNLISDLVGGIRVTVLEEETVRLPAKRSQQ